jgi:hypothetical protein
LDTSDLADPAPDPENLDPLSSSGPSTLKAWQSNVERSLRKINFIPKPGGWEEQYNQGLQDGQKLYLVHRKLGSPHLAANLKRSLIRD